MKNTTKSTKKFRKKIKKIIKKNKLPETNGVYEFFDQNGKSLYVGRSKNIKQRVLQHFDPSHASGEEITRLQNLKVDNIRYIITPNARIKEKILVRTKKPILNKVKYY